MNFSSDALHKLTTDLVNRFTLIGLEDLNARGMMANRPLRRLRTSACQYSATH